MAKMEHTLIMLTRMLRRLKTLTRVLGKTIRNTVSANRFILTWAVTMATGKMESDKAREL